jgi:hypothetical protein
MFAFLVVTLLFSSILYSATKYTYTKLNKTPSFASLVLLFSTISLLYVPREFTECAYVPIEDHVEVSFLLIMSEIARVVYGIPTDTLAPATTAAHAVANLATNLTDPCASAQFVAAIVIVVACAIIQYSRGSRHKRPRPNPVAASATMPPKPPTDAFFAPALKNNTNTSTLLRF